MMPDEVIRLCDDTIKKGFTQVVLVVPPRRQKHLVGQVRLLRSKGPLGKVIGETRDSGVVAMFNAKIVREYVRGLVK